MLRSLDGARDMSAVRALQNPIPSGAQVDTFRKMLLTIVEDARIVLVKLADRVCTLRAAKSWTQTYKQTIAREILEIYAPLANRLGLAKIKWELEDRAFFCLYPVAYKNIARELKARRLEREAYIHSAITVLAEALQQEGITAKVEGRVKHIYSIWRKLQKKSRCIDALYDLRALRVLVDKTDDCYRALSVVNALWEPIVSEFSDYIATPKPNGYRSVHTVVYGPERLSLEVQIRTHKMHEASELGVAAHWRYKEGVKYDPDYEARVSWLRSLLDWEHKLAGELAGNPLLNKIDEKRIYAFTPNGDVIDLEPGATVLDFAYMVHTMVGHRTKGAKINARIVPLTTKLSTGDQVEILTHKMPQPSLDWANAKSGFIHSPRIRARVARWFKEQNKAQNALLGKEQLVETLKSYRLKTVYYPKVAKHFNMPDEETFFAGIETGVLRFNQVVNYIVEHYSEAPQATGALSSQGFRVNERVCTKPQQSDLTVYGLDNLLSYIAGCCRPIRGDEIGGYLTHTRGVSVHRRVCTNFLKLQQSHPERIIEVQWGNKDSRLYEARLRLQCIDAARAMNEVTAILAMAKVTITRAKKAASANSGVIELGLALNNMEKLESIVKKLAAAANVEAVERVLA